MPDAHYVFETFASFLWPSAWIAFTEDAARIAKQREVTTHPIAVHSSSAPTAPGVRCLR